MAIPDLADRTIKSVLEAARHGHDPLGIAGHADADVPAAIFEALDGLDERTAALVAAAMPGAHQARDEAVDWRTQTPIDALTAELMADIGIDPMVAVWIAIHEGNYSIGDSETGQVLACVDGVRADHRMNGSHCWLGDGVRWRTCGEVQIRDMLPETVKIAVKGHLLKDVVSHPALDRHPMRIVHVGRDGAWTTIATDHQVEPATVEELAAHAPHGCR